MVKKGPAKLNKQPDTISARVAGYGANMIEVLWDLDSHARAVIRERISITPLPQQQQQRLNGKVV